jgi:hypothetical protein
MASPVVSLTCTVVKIVDRRTKRTRVRRNESLIIIQTAGLINALLQALY